MRKRIIIYTLLLSIIGLVMIYSSSYIYAQYKYNNPYRYVILQGIFFCMGIFIMYVFSKIDYNIYKKYSNLFLLISAILLILVLIPGIGSIRNGSRSWFGLFGLGFQPSELSKLSLIIFTSKYLSNNDKIKRDTNKFMLPILLIIISFFGLILLEPDFGTGMVIVCSLIGLIFISGVNCSIFIKLGILGICGIIVLILIAPYRLARITSFINPWSDPLGSGFQIIQSLYAIGPGGLLGFGFLNSRQKHFYLPEPQTDFIFSIITEEFGFIGASMVIILFILLYANIIKCAINQKDLFGKYLIFGLVFLLLFQTLLNLSVVVGLVPVTGVTLPFLSYGGSSLLISMASIGIILNVSKHE
ncbi:MAG: putative lipid II flippase FtsW [Bacilli bacterium]